MPTGSDIGASASIGSAVYGGLLMLAFGVGWLENLQSVGRWRRAFEILGGITLMVVGVYLLNEYYFWF